MTRMIVTLIAITMPGVLPAGSETGQVRFQHGQYGSSHSSAGKLFFFLDGGQKTGNPSCSSISGGDRWVIDNNRPAADMQLSILLAAAMSGKHVTVRGSNNCDVHSDSETAVDVLIK